jgi:ELWxxDGT repeat protein
MTLHRVLAALVAALVLPVALSAAPYLVDDLNPGPSEELQDVRVNPRGLALGPGGISYFSATDPAHGVELWRSDGTPTGTYRVTDICAGRCSSNPSSVQIFHGQIFFSADDGFAGAELWATDGTPGGEHRVRDLCAGPCSSSPAYFEEAGGSLLFIASNAALTTGGLVRSDGTPEGTYRIDGFSGTVNTLVALDDEVLFNVGPSDAPGSLWSSRGTADTTVQVIDLEFSNIGMVSLGDRAIFNRGFSFDLWVTDGTAAGTRKLNLPEHPNGPSGFAPAGRQAYFLRDEEGREANDLWVSDGSEAGTRRVKDFNVAPGSSGPLAQTAAGERLLFSAQTGEVAAPLFLTDGTALGTHVLSTEASAAFGFTRLGHRFLFSSQSGLWRTDGTAAGTTQVTPDFTDLSDAMAFGGWLFFSHRVYYWPSFELWRSNGTADGTVLVKDIDRYSVQAAHHQCYSEGSYPRPALILRGRLLLTANDGKHGREIWTSDGTARGTRILLDLNPLRSPEVPSSCEDDESPRTDTGLSSDPEDFVALGDIALFSATDGRTGRELWRTDGVPHHTHRIVDLRPGRPGSAPHDLVAFHGQVYFFASVEGAGETLWRTDGTARGTELVRDLALGGFPSWGRDLMVAGDQLFFVVFNETTGAELWVSGGDPASTALVGDLSPGPANAAPQSLTNVDGILVFAADDGLTGLEPWRSDGTPAGTFPLADLSPGLDASSPGPFTRIRQVLITGADDGAHGREPWAIPLADVLRP